MAVQHDTSRLALINIICHAYFLGSASGFLCLISRSCFVLGYQEQTVEPCPFYVRVSIVVWYSHLRL